MRKLLQGRETEHGLERSKATVCMVLCDQDIKKFY